MISGKNNKNIAIFLILLFTISILIFVQGCGKKADEESSGEENSEENGEEVQEASRSTAPAAAPAPAPAARPRPAAPSPAKSAKNSQSTVNIKSKPVPDDRFLPIEFDTKEAALITTGQTYSGKIRRNVFRDIKSSSRLRKDAEMAIEQAKKMIDKVKIMPAGSYNATLFKQADENLKQAESSFKDQNYFKAKAMAEKAFELASDSIPKAANSTDKPSIELLYKGFYQLSDEKTAMLTKKDPESGAEKLFMVRTGSVIMEELPNAITIEMPDGTQKKITKIEYKIEKINEDDIIITNITENKPSFNIPISRASASSITTNEKAKDSAPAKTSFEAKPAEIFKSNQNKSTSASGTGTKMSGY